MALPARAPRVLLVGAYERDNFGDLLFLLVTERYLDGADVVAAAPFSADMRHLLGREIPAYGPLLQAEAFDAIWTVGGQVGRVDLRRAYRGKMLGRVGGAGFGRRDDALSRRLVETIRVLALERYDEGVHERLAFNLRVRSALVREGRYESLHHLAAFESALRARLKLRVSGGDGEQLALRLTATLGEAGELDFVHEGDRMLWRPPEPLRDALADADLDVTQALQASHVQVFVRSLHDGIDYLVPSETELSLAGPGAAVRPRLEARVDIQAARGAAGAPLPEGDWEVHALVNVAGFSHARPLRRNGAPLVLRSSSPARVVARWAVLPRPLLARRLAARVPLRSQPRQRATQATAA